jgi:hypothetical protein
MQSFSARGLAALVFVMAAVVSTTAAFADDDSPATHAKFTDGLTPQHGLFTVWRKDGKVALELASNQFNHDYLLSIVPGNGLGGFGMYVGAGDYYSPRIVRFVRQDNKVAILYPNTNFYAPAGTPDRTAVEDDNANSVLGVSKIVATDDKSGAVIIEASPLLGDVIDLKDALKVNLGNPEPGKLYQLDSDRSYFGPTKSFPDNTLIDVRQTWATDDASIIDNVMDPRAIEFRIDYNFIEPPNSSDYMPRFADDRVGYFSTVQLDFGTEKTNSRQRNYIIRWNMQKSDPNAAMSPAKHPMVFYMSNGIPFRYRNAIRKACLEWNKAFLPLGITDAVQVKDQPNDPNWDPDDVRYSVLRWLTDSNGGGFLEAQIYADPRTGQEFRTGVILDADYVQFGHLAKPYIVDPVAAANAKSFAARERLTEIEKHNQAAYAAIALQVLGDWPGGDVPQSYIDDFLMDGMLHEVGHDMGFQHNFIAGQGYTSAQVRNRAFTMKNGLATTVMAYNPVNIWPHGQSTGTLFMDTIGPYDYWLIHWGYAPVKGARTPEDELPTLRAWAAEEAKPLYRFASDEDVSWFDGHAIDPRVNQFSITNDMLGYAKTQLGLAKSIIGKLDGRFPRTGHPFEDERDAASFVWFEYRRYASMLEHYIGGEYLSRGHAGDPGAAKPLVPVSRAEARTAWTLLDQYVFSDSAFHFNPATLNRLTYQEFSPFNGGAWAYDPPERHDLPVAAAVGALQGRVLGMLFTPLRLQRIDELSLRSATGSVPSISDLFNWTQDSVYGDLRNGNLRTVPLFTRNLQARYTQMLIKLALNPAKGTPSDAQALARAKLVSLSGTLRQALGSSSLDEVSRAHLGLLQNQVGVALEGRKFGYTGGGAIRPVAFN